MRLSRAEVLCPKACFLPADEPAYRAAHQVLEGALRRFTDRVETADMGLLFADVTGSGSSSGSDTQLPRRMAAEIGQAARLDVRVGLAGDRFTAEQAARAAPPSTGSGQSPGSWCAVPAGQECAFLSPLPLSTLPAEPEVLHRLHQLGIRTLGALAKLPRLALIRQFGSHAGFLHDLASARDPRPVHSDAPPLVLEGAHIFEPPVVNRGPLAAWTGRIVAALAADISQRGYQAEGLQLCVEDEEGDTHTVATSVEPPTADPERLTRQAVALLDRPSPSHPVADLKVVLYPLRPAYLGATQLTLFSGPADSRHTRLQEVLRRLRERFGEMIIVVASLLGPPPPRPIQVTTDPMGFPRALIFPDHILPLPRIYEHWRERRRWWARPVLRDYYRAETPDGQVRIVFRDRSSDRWWLERRYL
jgi:DNA polymerase-4